MTQPVHDVGAFGGVDGRSMRTIQTYVCVGLLLLSSCMTLYLLSGFCSPSSANLCGGILVCSLILSNTVRRIPPLLWKQHGRHTSFRVVEKGSHLLLPLTMKARMLYSIMIADLLLLPMWLGIHVFSTRGIAQLLSVFTLSPVHAVESTSWSSFFFMLLFWVLPPVLLFCSAVHFWMISESRWDPYFSDGNPSMRRYGELAGSVAAALVIPTFATLTSVFSCEPSFTTGGHAHLRYATGIHCFSYTHRAHIFFGLFWLLLVEMAMDITIEPLYILKDNSTATQSSIVEYRMDALFMEVVRVVRTFAIIITIVAPPAIGVGIAGWFLLSVLLWARFSLTALSSVQCVDGVYQYALLSSVASGASAFVFAYLWGTQSSLALAAWAAVWIGCCGVAVYRCHYKYGNGFSPV